MPVKNLFAAMIALVGLVFMPVANALLEPGADAPDFTADAALAGKPFSYSLSAALQKGPVVLFFYPKAFTGGCTVQVHMFSEAVDEFAALGATVIGMSNDTLEKQLEFSAKECGDKLAVAADPEGKTIKAYDAQLIIGMEKSKRASFVITPDHKVFYVYSDMDPKQHVAKTLAAVQAWKAGKPAPAAE